ncbi:YncE family protein [Tunturiibacter lichenicola]|uniref:YncE family protein n=1 Tax=Tunturiibacter lichenicola TaxID=2051959 RepID=UPI0021B2C889|nr:YncE family protein [Edaphobacter lichenicola]
MAQTIRTASRHTFQFALAAAVIASIAGCGNNYRPVITAISPVGPAAQPQKFAVAISSTGTPTNPTAGLLTFVDFSGDTILITANVGVNPYYLILNNTTVTSTSAGTTSTATTGFTLNSDRTFSTFDIDTTLLTSQVLQSTLPPNACPLAIFPEGTSTYVTNSATNPGPCPGITNGPNAIFQFAGSPLNLQQQLVVDPAFSPIYTVGVVGAPRVFAISQSNTGGPGQVNTIETASNTVDPVAIPVGRGPVYGIMTGDASSAAKRAFILNQTDGTVTVINAQTNLLDNVPTGATNPIVVGANPLWADAAPVRNEIVVANAGDGVTPGSVSIISVPLCSATAQPNNPNCDLNSPVDAAGFGTVLANVPVGINPVMIAVLQDTTNSRAYVVNSGNRSLPCAAPTAALPLGNCTVSVINLATNTVTATIPIPQSTIVGITPNINGHPTYIAASSGTPTGKVYVTSPESNFMTVIRTDIDAIDTTVPLQGNGVSVRVTAP